MRIVMMRSNEVGRSGVLAAAVLFALTGCGAEATGEQASSNAMMTQPRQPIEAQSVRTKSAALSSVSIKPGAIECPATLRSGTTLPRGARLLGAPLAAGLSLSSATVTADAVEAVASDLDGLAEVESVERPGSAGMVVQRQDVTPTADAPFALICRYGDAKPPLLAQSAVLIPLPANGAGYRCTTRLPQGKDPRAASAICERS
jgi:hypothetical protein